LEGQASDGAISGFDLAPMLADPAAYANNIEQAGTWKFDPAAKTPYKTLKTKLVLDKGELHFTHFSLLTDPLLIQADDNLAVYNLIDNQFSFPGKFVTRQPVTLNQDGLRVSIKQVTLPFELTGSPEGAQLKVKWQRLNNSPLGQFVKQRKDKEAEAQKQAAEQAAAQKAAVPQAQPDAATEGQAVPTKPEAEADGSNPPPAQSAPAGQSAPDTPAAGDKPAATAPATPAAPAPAPAK
ncbi:MAG: hypothetical protein ACREXO_16620, partial [Advenella sp.]